MGQKIDMTGQKYGRLTVLHEDTDFKGKWVCQCDCGNIVSIRGYDIRSGKTQSCGCLRNERVREAVGNKLTGQRFGRLTVIEQVDSIREPSGQLRTAWKCKCDCGNEVIVKTLNLKSGDTKSCGCLGPDLIKERRLDLTGQKFGKLTALYVDEEYMEKYRPKENTRAYWKCQCECGNLHTVSADCLTRGETTSCGCSKSHGEDKISNILQEAQISFIKQFSFPDLRDVKILKFDFAIFNQEKLIALIEYQGEQHFYSIEYFGGESAFEAQKKRDKMKRDYCYSHHIPLICIPYTDYQKLSLKYLEDKYNAAKEIC